MGIQFQPILTNFFIVCLGLTSGQLENQWVDQAIAANNDGQLQESFQNLFNSMASNGTEISEIYRKILKHEVTNERQAFDAMKEEWELARVGNVLSRTNLIRKVKREAKKKASKAGKKKADERRTKRPSKRAKKHPDGHTPNRTQEEEKHYNMWEYTSANEEDEEPTGVDEEGIQVGEMNEHREHLANQSSEEDFSFNMWEPLKVKKKVTKLKDEETPEIINEDDIQFGGGDEGGLIEGKLSEDGKYIPPFADEGACPVSNQDVTKSENKSALPDWEFYYNDEDFLENDTLANGTVTSTTLGALTYLDMEDDGPVTPPYGPDEMRTKSDISREDDLEWIESEWRQKWAEKSDDEQFEEALAHAKRETLVNWYQHAEEQWADLEEMKKHAAAGNCVHSVLSEPIEIVEIRLNKAMKAIAKYIAKFDYGEATGEKLI